MAMKKTVKPKAMPKPKAKAKRPSASAGKSNPKAAAKGKGTGTKTEYEWKIPARAGAQKPLKELKATTKAKAADKAKRIAIGNENAREYVRGNKNYKDKLVAPAKAKGYSGKKSVFKQDEYGMARRAQRSGGKGR